VSRGWQTATQSAILSSTEIVDKLLELEEEGRIRGPYRVEEFLEGPNGPGSLVPCPSMSRPTRSTARCRRFFCANATSTDDHRPRYRYIDATGNDLDGLIDGSPTDFGIAAPANLDAIVEAASRISIAFETPFLRVDLFSIGGRVVFGEVTPRPGREEWFGPELDTAFGLAWEAAKVRLELARLSSERDEL
jgi:hypothetical protein